MVTAAPSNGAESRTIIIGAGLAGMIAADKLKQAGHDVTLLEGQTRPGGRVQTLRTAFTDGLYAEAGATFVPGGHDLTLKLIRRLGIGLHPIPDERSFTLWMMRGQKMRIGVDESWPFELSTAEQAGGLQGMFEKYVAPSLEGIGDIRDPNWPPPSLQKLDEQSYFDFLQSKGASPGAIIALRRMFPDIYGDGVEDCSALYCLRDFTNEDGGLSLVEGGTDRIAYGLAAELGGSIIYGARVDRIEHGDKDVAVRYLRDGQEHWLQGDNLILAIQYSCLNAIEVSPPLPSEKARFVSGMGFTAISRAFFQTRSRYWGEDGPEYMAITDMPAIGIRDCSVHLPGKKGLVDCYVPGPGARALDALNEEARIERAGSWIDALLPGLSDQIEAFTYKSWGADPFARGGYAYCRPGEMKPTMAQAAKPVGRIYFAGDHLSPWPAWMQGAIHSGLRAAAEIASPD
jgi:monoamine oxidase